MPQERARVLVVDDDPMLVRVMQRALAAEFDVAVAAEGHSALRLMEGEFFAAVITDVMMPGLTGLDVFQILCNTNPLQARRVIFVTGGAWAVDSDQQLAATGQPVLEKPFTFAALGEIARTVADQAPQGPNE